MYDTPENDRRAAYMAWLFLFIRLDALILRREAVNIVYQFVSAQEAASSS